MSQKIPNMQRRAQIKPYDDIMNNNNNNNNYYYYYLKKQSYPGITLQNPSSTDI